MGREIAEFATYTMNELLLWGVAITIMVISGFYFLNMAYKKEDTNERLILYGFSGLIFGFAVCYIFCYIQWVNFEGVVKENVFYKYEEQDKGFVDFYFVGIIAAVIGVSTFVYTLEITLIRTKYLLTILNISFITISIIISFFNLGLAFDIVTVVSMGDLIIYFSALFLLIKRSNPEFKPVVLFILIGSIILGAGHSLRTTVLGIQLYIQIGYPLELRPLLIIIGAIAVVAPTLIKPERLSNAIYYWYILFIVLLTLSPILSFIMLNYYLNPPDPGGVNPTIALFGFICGFIVLLFALIQAIKLLRESSPAEKEVKLQVFSRPQRVTEEEVTISKEKKICLVCKSKLSRFNIYICPDCDTFYCEKCATELINIENACWVCEEAIDELKPVNIQEREKEEEELVDSEISKVKKKISQ